MLGPLGGPELAIILVIVLVLFGVGRISGLGKELGGSIREFRRAVKDEDKEQNVDMTPQQHNTTAEPAPPAAERRAPAESATGSSQSSGEGKPPSVF